jgi:hypothetical protein
MIAAVDLLQTDHVCVGLGDDLGYALHVAPAVCPHASMHVVRDDAEWRFRHG